MALLPDPGNLPAHAFPSKFTKHGQCSLIPGLLMNHGGQETKAGDNLHRRGFGGDPDVIHYNNEWVMVFNHPIWEENIQRWVTSIFKTTSKDGLKWTVPQAILLPEFTGTNPQPIQFETPSLRWDSKLSKWLLAVLQYQYRFGNREDSIQVFQSDNIDGPYERRGIPLEPKLWHETPFVSKSGKQRGGIQEPSLFRFGSWWMMGYGAISYDQGRLPTACLAGSQNEGQSWFRFDRPVIFKSNQVIGQPDLVVDTVRGGIHWFWQERKSSTEEHRDIYEIHHGFSLDDLNIVYENPNNPILSNDNEDYWDSGRIAGFGATIVENRFQAWYFGSKGPAKSGYENWIGYCSE